MTIDPRIIDAMILLIVGILGMLANSLVVIPRAMNARLEASKNERELEYKERMQALEDKTNEANAKIADNAAEREVLKGLVANTGELVNSISVMARNMVSDLSERVEMRKVVAANSEVMTEQVEAIGEFGDKLDNLLDTGSKPLRDANDKLDKLVISVLEVKTTQAESATKLEGILSKINELQLTLAITKRVTEEKLAEVKEATSEVKAVLIPPA